VIELVPACRHQGCINFRERDVKMGWVETTIFHFVQLLTANDKSLSLPIQAGLLSHLSEGRRGLTVTGGGPAGFAELTRSTE
jgi:hypothetical protein